ncbi:MULTISPECIES: hypothetical protein [unclassified Rhizobium]|uniref:DUF805 domain-containing protein n=1 Tax=unclassified Rhizobium TaxID=2613769 RepID=UPI00131A608C|nr:MULTISPECIES: hypothetical protein [Rhizobium]MDK4737948.1 hypothetical protein [Rhizobium sp. CNPSo 3464]UWU23127.1 hypothetical protein N2601_09365 [Rhizobium tropici]
MIDILFGFRGTLGRRQYFWWHFGVGCLAGILLALLLDVMAFTGNGKPTILSPWALLPFGLFLAPFIWMDLSIQSARMRDIGVPPLRVFLAFVLIFLVTTAVSIFMHDGSIEKIFNILYRGIGVVYSALLLFAPSGCLSHWMSPDPEDTDQNGRPAPVAYVAPNNPTTGRTSFGQRGLNRS